MGTGGSVIGGGPIGLLYLQVFRAGTINVYDEKGIGIKQITESLDAEELAARLKAM